MNDNEKYEHWRKHAQEDLLTADAMLYAGRWTYVAFCCQQTIEKLVKGLYGLYFGFDKIPRVHNISWLVHALADKIQRGITQEQYAFFDTLLSQ